MNSYSKQTSNTNETASVAGPLTLSKTTADACSLCENSGCRHDGHEFWDLLGYNAASSGNSVPTF